LLVVVSAAVHKEASMSGKLRSQIATKLWCLRKPNPASIGSRSNRRYWLPFKSALTLRNVLWPGGCLIPPDTPNTQQQMLVAEYHRKWREESLSWNAFEALASDGLEASNATLGRSSDAIALQLGCWLANDSYVEAYIRGEGISFCIGQRQVTPEEFVALGEAYWKAFEQKGNAD
jgi:hypothetical protein